MATVFKVNPLPDGGHFCDSGKPAIAYDVLKRVGQHRIPSTIDLSRCVHLKPYSVGCLCALGLLGREDGTPIELVLPEDAGCASHLRRLGLAQFFEAEGEDADEDDDTRNTNLVARRVTKAWGQDARDIIELLAEHTSLAAGELADMETNLSEVIANALSHSDSPIDCVVVGQCFPGTNKIEVCVVDLGQTIRGHLTKNPKYADLSTDKAAIEAAVTDGVTGTPAGQKNKLGEPNSGSGLTNLRTYCESGRGELTVLSGNSWISYREGHEPSSNHLRGGFRGCVVNIRYFAGFDLPEDAAQPIL
ncbi:MAG: hypothetical protein AAGF47_05565 [Planctomycetota bacterium]